MLLRLSQELIIKNSVIRNRIVMPPMVCFGWADDSGKITERHIKHYSDRARGGVGLIIVEAAAVEKDGRLAPSQIGIWDDEHIDGLSRLAAECHRYGAKILIQIHHAGSRTSGEIGVPLPVAPSAVDDGNKKAREMTLDELHSLQASFVKAAVRAQKAGFDGIEFHGAHGYLMDQFASPLENWRKDAYGGSMENRMRFAVETIGMVKKEVNEDFLLDYRMGGNEPTIDEGVRVAQILEKAGIDLLHVSRGIGNMVGLNDVPEGFPFNSIVYSGTVVKKNVKVPVIVVNGIRSVEQVEYLLENNLTDLVAIGKGMLADPEWAGKAEVNKKIIQCNQCPRCLWFDAKSERCPAARSRAR